MKEKNDIQSQDDIKLMVDAFYTKVKSDALLAPIFFDRIKGDWQQHLEKMYQFWNAALLGIPGYRGTPFVPHASMPIRHEHFNQWLTLFDQTIQEHFEGPMATDASNRAHLMAKLFTSKLAAYQSRPGTVPLV